MLAVKNLAGLSILLAFFGLSFLFFFGLFIYGTSSIFGGSIGLIPLVALGASIGGLYMSGGVLWLFFRNFSWSELMTPDKTAEREHAPVAIEVKYDDEKTRRYLVDSRHSPRSSNPRKHGRGVFIMTRKRGKLIDSRDVVTLIDSKGTKVKSVRNFADKIHFDFIDTNKTHTMTIAALTEHATNFERSDSWEALETKHDSKEQIAEAWADSIKKG